MNFSQLTISLALLLSLGVSAQKPQFQYTISMESPSSHLFHVSLHCSGLEGPILDLKMPAWMPGYYQLLDYAGNVSNFHATGSSGDTLSWARPTRNTWRIEHPAGSTFTVTYDVLAKRAFVAQPWLDSTHAYITPTGVFLYVDGHLREPVTLTVHPTPGWNHIATGLAAVKGQSNTYSAPDLDIFYDSPILVGGLEELPSFKVRGIPHYFTGYQLGEFDRQQFVDDLQKIITQGVAVIDDIPYKDYTFLAIGKGSGGIEHLNSASVGFTGTSMKTPEGRQRMLCFLAHEYFHHYNVKRIRPLALGPFDYQQANKTDQLWVSEGLTVYYEYMLVYRAGLMTGKELLHHFQSDMAAYENVSGHLYQSLAQASEGTWSEGPFGGKKDSSISYYQKGPVVGLLLDLAIRHYTGNKRSLDDVMRALYRTYYQEKKRGFTGAEFRRVCETTAGTDLPELFDYVYTVKEPDYAKYLAYGGMGIDKDFAITPLPQADALQTAIRASYQ